MVPGLLLRRCTLGAMRWHCLATPLRTATATSATPRSVPTHRAFSTARVALRAGDKDVVAAKTGGGRAGALTTTERVKEGAKTTLNVTLIAAGAGITATLLYFVTREVFSSNSPNVMYGHALKDVQRNAEVQALLGKPIKGFGETTSRGRRRHVSFQEFVVHGRTYMRLRFYVSGPNGKGTCHLELKESGNSFDVNYLVVEIPGGGLPSRTIVIHDNRE